jgi:hypothetical protein
MINKIARKHKLILNHKMYAQLKSYAMKKNFVLIVLMLSAFTIVANSQELALNAKNASPAYKWVTDTIISLGKIELNKPKEVVFEFINTGAEPLIITKVEPSCGCTSVDFSRNPIKKGEKGFIKTTYNAASSGFFQKTLTVFANTPEYKKVLTIKGEVIK